MDNTNTSIEQERTDNWQKKLDSEIGDAFKKEEAREPWLLVLDDIDITDINNYMTEKYEEEFPSILPSRINTENTLIEFKAKAGIYGEMATISKKQPLYFIVRGNKVIAFLPLIKTKDVDIVQGHEAERTTENTPKDGIYCWFFNKLRFDNNTLLEEKYGDVAWRC